MQFRLLFSGFGVSGVCDGLPVITSFITLYQRLKTPLPFQSFPAYDGCIGVYQLKRIGVTWKKPSAGISRSRRKPT